jgi:hypothetical protein
MGAEQDELCHPKEAACASPTLEFWVPGLGKSLPKSVAFRRKVKSLVLLFYQLNYSPLSCGADRNRTDDIESGGRYVRQTVTTPSLLRTRTTDTQGRLEGDPSARRRTD